VIKELDKNLLKCFIVSGTWMFSIFYTILHFYEKSLKSCYFWDFIVLESLSYISSTHSIKGNTPARYLLLLFLLYTANI